MRRQRGEVSPAAFYTLLVAAVLGFFWLVACSPMAQDREKVQAERDAADRVPRVVSRADGCDVYAFKPESGGSWRYFTRCANGTTTDNSRTVRTGKTTREERDTIPTTNGR